MSNPTNELPPDIRTLLQHEREIPPVPAAVRARALARARASLEGRSQAAYVPRVAAPPRLRWAVAACVTFAAAAAVGAGAYEVRLHLVPQAPVPAAPAAPVVARPAPVTAPAVAPAVEPIAEAELPAVSHEITTPRLSRTDSDRAELRLVRMARSAVARQDFGAALGLLTEHARRFKDGRLAEEREALRVRALAGLGRTEEARRAAGQFQARFPRSVLLPAVRQMPGATP
ncbi:MAG TPA: hypothetical protein VN962_24785 [Polyangia bacterium]|nr:hypothetical protein [Polyangia bacterium]